VGRVDRFARFVTVVAIGAAALHAQAPAAGDPAKVLAQAREALGGDKKLAAITSFVATGRTRQVRGDNLVPIEFEISVALPDKYVRRDEIPAQESGPTSTGFNGDDIIQLPLPQAPPTPAAGARPGGPGGAAPGAAQDAARKARVNNVKQDFAKLTLGMFAASFDGFPLTFTYAGQAQAPSGTADVIDAKSGTTTLRLFIDSTTHLPLMVSWPTPVTPANIIVTAPGQPKPANAAPGAIVVEGPAVPAATATAEERDQYAKDVRALQAKTLASAKPIQNYLYYADYRDAGGGAKFPFRLRKAIGADTVEETNFDGFKLNAKIDPKKFEVVK
jgi:hypothetical protein